MNIRPAVLAVVGLAVSIPVPANAGDKPFGYGPLPRGAWACLGSPRFVSDNPAHLLAFSPDGKLLATGTHEFSGGTDIHLWDLETGVERVRFKGHRRQVVGLLFTADCKSLISAAWDDDYAIRVWDVATGNVKRRIVGHTAVITGVALTPDGKHLISSSQDGTMRVWDFASGKELRSMKCGGTRISLARDGRTVVVPMGDKAQMWDIETGQPTRTFGKFNVGGARRICLSPDGKKAAVVEYRRVSVWDIEQDKELHQFNPKRDIYSVAFSPDGKLLATCGGGYKNPGAGWDDFLVELQLWDVETGKEKRGFKAPSNVVEDVAFSPDGKLLASADRDFRTTLWDVKTGEEWSRFGGHGRSVTSLVFTSASRLISASHDGTIRIWDAELCKQQAVLTGHGKSVMALSSTSDGKTLASGGLDGTVRLWDLAKGREMRLLADKHGDVWCLAFSPDGKTLATADRGRGGAGGSVRLWDWQAGNERLRLEKQEGAHCLAFAPDGKTFAVGHHPHITLWDTQTGKNVHQFQVAHGEWVDNVAYLPDGSLLSAGSGDKVMEKTSRHWDLVNKVRRHQFGLDTGYRTTMAVSPDGRLMAWACENRLRIWEVATKFKVAELVGHRKHISVLAFAPDGQTLASGGADGAILFWDLTGCRKNGELAGKPLADSDFANIWRDLGREDGRPELWKLALAPKQTVPLLRQRLCNVAKPDPTHLRQLVKDLGSSQFGKRDKATRELQDLGESAATALEQSLKEKPSVELARRVRMLLERIEAERVKERENISTETVQMLRAVEALERIATVDAQAVLQAMADGATTARGQQEARAALQRLKLAPP